MQASYGNTFPSGNSLSKSGATDDECGLDGRLCADPADSASSEDDSWLTNLFNAGWGKRSGKGWGKKSGLGWGKRSGQMFEMNVRVKVLKDMRISFSPSL